MKKKISELFHNTNLTWSLLFFSVLIVNAFVDPTPSESSSFFLNLKATPTATITVTNTEFCLGEQTTITFEGADGNPNYSFTYTLNGGAEQTITTENSEISVTLNSEITASGTYTYSLIGVTDSSDGGSITEINDQEITITVTDPPTVDFDFTNDNACSGETIQFTSNATGDGTLSYSWNFGDGETSTEENPVKVYNELGSGSVNFSVTLTITDSNGCSNTKTRDLSVLGKPNLKFRDGNFNDFGNCGSIESDSEEFELLVQNISPDITNIVSYSIAWGDTETTSDATFPITHLYSDRGVFTMIISAIDNNGCSNEVSYQINNISNPAVGFESPGFTQNLCAPSLLNFGLTNWGTNSLDTYYTIEWGDGLVETYTQSELQVLEKEDNPGVLYYNASNPENSETIPIDHTYSSGSCSNTDGSFTINVTATNNCGYTPFTVSNITILEKSIANFTIEGFVHDHQDENSEIADDIFFSCLNNQPVKFFNNTIIGDGNNCVKYATYDWKFERIAPNDPAVVEILYSDSDNSPGFQTYSFPEPGTYEVTLIVNGKCGGSSFKETICVEPDIIASYDTDTQEGCIPLAVSTQNTIDKDLLCGGSQYNSSFQALSFTIQLVRFIQ